MNWFDGMVISSRHLEHADRQAEALVSLGCLSCVDQPGLLWDSLGAGTASPLITVGAPSQLDGEWKLPIGFERAFAAVAPSGRLVIVLPQRNTAGDSRSSCGASLNAEDVNASEPLLVCVRQGDGASVTRVEAGDSREPVELRVPALDACVKTRAAFEQDVRGTMADFVPIGAVNLVNNDATVSPDYIPPVTKLAGVLAFDAGILARISSQCDELLRVVEENIDAAGEAFSAGAASQELMSRRADYEALRTILFVRAGLTSHLAAFSPIRFVSEVAQPLATWWVHHQGRHFEGSGVRGEGPVGTTNSLAGELLSIGLSNLSAGSDLALRAIERFLSSMTTVLQIG